MKFVNLSHGVLSVFIVFFCLSVYGHSEEQHDNSGTTFDIAEITETGIAMSSAEPGERSIFMGEVVVKDQKPVTAASNREIRERDFELLPIITRPSGLLRVVPGLLAIQHAGGGKADQYFLRGFDTDHGTDLALFVDRLPVNLVSHAHGQGYADLNFLIPEIVETIEVYKGPYFAEFGDFANAGAVRFVTKDFVPEGLVQASGGLYAVDRFRPLARGITRFSPVVTRDVKTIAAFEILYDEGPFIEPNDLVRLNGFGKFSWDLTRSSRLEIWGSAYYSDWDASGQIPLRAVQSGEIDRFGSVDPSEGGDSQRYNLYLQYTNLIDSRSDIEATFYFSRYTLDLFSNFTFFLEDPENGDGIVQRDDRYMYGSDARFNRIFFLFGRDHLIRTGLQTRFDHNDIVFANQTERRQRDLINDVDIFQLSVSPWVETDITVNEWIRTVVGMRFDVFHFDVNDNLDSTDLGGSKTDSIISYKANLILSPLDKTDFYLNFGTGFHSNDARVVVNAASMTLPRSIGFELGSRTRILDDRLDLAGAFWFLYLQEELVFEGDEGTFEPSGSTRRLGGELEARLSLYQRMIFIHADINIVDAEFTDGGKVPLAPTFVSRSGLSLFTPFGLNGALEIIHVADRPAEETDTVKASGFTRVDLTTNYRYGNLEFFAIVENLFDTNYREAQFFNESRLQNEPEGVEDIHFVAGNPFTFRIGVTYYLNGIIDRI